jgi:phosphoglycolate phosphatase (TIGR01487 family)
MYFFALATDYDGTIAEDGVVAETTVEALRELKQSGRKLILVTGRQLPDLRDVLPEIALFDLIIAENGGLLFDPKTGEETLLATQPPQVFLDALRACEVPVSAGRCIVATTEPHQHAVLEAIRELGLELQIIFNKGAVMVLPAGISKASGLEAALALLGLSPHNVVGIGDAENDHAFLRLCGCAVAVANALPTLKECADFVTEEPRGTGVASLVRQIIADDLARLTEEHPRHAIELALNETGASIRISPRGGTVLIAGMSGGGKSAAATGLLERFLDGGFQFCVIDREGDYADLENTVSLGDAKHEPRLEEAAELLRHVKQNLVINLLGVQLQRPPYRSSCKERFSSPCILTGSRARRSRLSVSSSPLAQIRYRRCAHFVAPWVRNRLKYATSRSSVGSRTFGSGRNVGCAVYVLMNPASIFGDTRANMLKASWARTTASTSAGQRVA